MKIKGNPLRGLEEHVRNGRLVFQQHHAELQVRRNLERNHPVQPQGPTHRQKTVRHDMRLEPATELAASDKARSTALRALPPDMFYDRGISADVCRQQSLGHSGRHGGACLLLYSDQPHIQDNRLWPPDDHLRATAAQQDRQAATGNKSSCKGQPKPDSKLRDTEEGPLGEDIHEYLQREVAPHVPDAWIDEEKMKIGYEIPFNRYFYAFKPPRELDETDKELKGVTD